MRSVTAQCEKGVEVRRKNEASWVLSQREFNKTTGGQRHSRSI